MNILRHGKRGTARISTLMLATVFAVAATASIARAQGVVSVADPVDMIRTTGDELPVHMTYYESAAEKAVKKESPVIILLHAKGSSRLMWGGEQGVAARLQRDGFAVVTVDLRYHGESQKLGTSLPAGNINTPEKKSKKNKSGDLTLKADDYVRMVTMDMEAVKKFIYDENQAQRLNMSRCGVIGPEMGASVAAAFALNDWVKPPHDDGPAGNGTPRGQDVRAVALISPSLTAFPGIPVQKSLIQLREPRWNVAFFVAYGEGDKSSREAAEKALQAIRGNEKSRAGVYDEPYPGNLQGANMINAKLGLEDKLIAFCRAHVKAQPGKANEFVWRDRQSRREKKR